MEMDEQRPDEPQYKYVDDVRYELDDDGNIIVETGEPYCEECQYYHTDEAGCRCPECGGKVPCGVAGHD